MAKVKDQNHIGFGQFSKTTLDGQPYYHDVFSMDYDGICYLVDSYPAYKLTWQQFAELVECARPYLRPYFEIGFYSPTNEEILKALNEPTEIEGE